MLASKSSFLSGFFDEDFAEVATVSIRWLALEPLHSTHRIGQGQLLP